METARNASETAHARELDRLRHIVTSSTRLVALTGAGCSTDSGIPDYRAEDGSWKSAQPMRISEFTRSERARQRYWARSFVGWRRVADARPNPAHGALAELEARGKLHYLITQNVDGLHQAAGSRRVVNLHGRLSRVICLGCDDRTPRHRLQGDLAVANPGWATEIRGPAPDGDADVGVDETAAFNLVHCRRCGGHLKPDVVFFGENVPPHRVRFAMDRVGEADALLVVGSSLMVWSGYRFVRAAAGRGIPIGIVNIGKTRGDHIASLKIEGNCAAVLSNVLDAVRRTSS